MAFTYSLLYGKSGLKEGFKKMITARKAAQIIANKTGKVVYIDKVITSPRWQQIPAAKVKPKK